MSLESVHAIPERVLAIYAHPDDADVSCGGTLARWSDEGCVVHVVVCTVGDKGSADPEANIEALITERSLEIKAAQQVLGVDTVHLLSFRDGEIENDVSLRQELVGLIRRVQPTALVCPDPLAVFFGAHYYNHRDHRVVGFAALDAASPAASSPLYFPDQGLPHAIDDVYLSASLEPTVYVDVTSTIDRKADAVLCHQTQLGESGEAMRELFYDRARETGRVAGVDFAEAFRRIRLAH